MLTHSIDVLHHRAVASLVVSIFSAPIAFGGITPMIQNIAGCVAIASGLMAIRYYYYATKERRRK